MADSPVAHTAPLPPWTWPSWTQAQAAEGPPEGAGAQRPTATGQDGVGPVSVLLPLLTQVPRPSQCDAGATAKGE